MHITAELPGLSRRLPDALSAERGPLLFAIRLWASVCLALFVAFWLQLDNPYWAGASATVVCQLQLGASLRKGWFRMIGTVTGAVVIVVLTACFPQDRIAYLGLLALWGGLCAFAATALRNFASYAAALAGYTAAIIAADNLGATGGASPDVFLLAVWRATEVCIGIASAGIVLAATDFGGARRRLAASFADLAVGIAAGFNRMLEVAGSRAPDRQSERHELLRRVIALEPSVDQTLGESSHVHGNAVVLEAGVRGLLRALDGWSGVAANLSRLADRASGHARAILLRIPPELRSAAEPGAARRWMADPMALRRVCDETMRALLAFPADTPSAQLLADQTARVLAGLAHALDGLALLIDAPDRSSGSHRGFRPGVADWLPAVLNGVRAFLAIGVVALFWILTAWPDGGSAIFFVMMVVLLLAPRGDVAYGGALAVTLGVIGSLICVAVTKFAMLPAFETFPAFCASLGCFLVPVGFAMARSQKLAAVAIFTAITAAYLPLLAPTNQMSYDTSQFYNSALAAIVGVGVGALAFALLPPLPPAARARRLLALSLRDLRRMADARWLPTRAAWEARAFARVAAMPDQAEPPQRAQLLAALSVGSEIIQLRHLSVGLGGVASELEGAFDMLARGDSARAIGRLRLTDGYLGPQLRPATESVLRARGHILLMCEAIAEHASYFNEEKVNAAR